LYESNESNESINSFELEKILQNSSCFHSPGEKWKFLIALVQSLVADESDMSLYFRSIENPVNIKYLTTLMKVLSALVNGRVIAVYMPEIAHWKIDLV
jgi:hypothetical protein